MAENEKIKLAMYWAAACGGCEIAVLNIGEHILAIDNLFDIVFFPCIADFKKQDVENYPDDFIDVCLFDGAIRNSENEEMARLLRQKSKVLVAFGSCAYEGCIMGLSNLTSKEATLHTIFADNPSLDNVAETYPLLLTTMPEGDLTIPDFYHTVKALDQVVEVDYYVPGCPPVPHQIWAVLQVVAAALIQGAPLPPSGSIMGAGDTAVCQTCPREKHQKKIKRFYRPSKFKPEPDVCLLEQGIICMGAATRSGCGALCPQVGMGCRGCYGALDGVYDMGAKMVSAIASVIDAGAPDMDEADIVREIEAVLDTIPDPAGTFYRFSMAHSLLQRAKVR